MQNGSAITGSILFADYYCAGVGSVTGTVSGSTVSLAVNPTGMIIDLDGTTTGQTSMGGNYTILSTGCTSPGNIPGTGTWTADLVTPVNGSFQGSITSNRLGAFTITGQVSQGSNTGASTAALTGSVSVTGYCFSDANIVGSISGTNVVMNLVDSTTGAQLGQMDATAALDGSSMIGTFNFVGQGNSGVQGCKSGDGGTFTFTM